MRFLDFFTTRILVLCLMAVMVALFVLQIDDEEIAEHEELATTVTGENIMPHNVERKIQKPVATLAYPQNKIPPAAQQFGSTQQPSSRPTNQPSSSPTQQPPGRPTNQPSTRPTQKPSQEQVTCNVPADKPIKVRQFGVFDQYVTFELADGSAWIAMSNEYVAEDVGRMLVDVFSYWVGKTLGMQQHLPQALAISKNMVQPPCPFTETILEKLFASEELRGRKGIVVVEKVKVERLMYYNQSLCFGSQASKASFLACVVPNGDISTGPHAVHNCFENDAKLTAAGQASPDRRSCSDHSEIEELASVTILDYLFLNEDRHDNSFGRADGTGIGHAHVMVYIDNSGDGFHSRSQDFLKRGSKCEESYVQPMHKDSAFNLVLDTELHKEMHCGGLPGSKKVLSFFPNPSFPFRCYGLGFGKMNFNCHLQEQVREALTKYKNGKEFVDALKEVAGERQLAEMVNIYSDLEKNFLMTEGFFSRRYDCLRNHVIRIPCRLP